MNEKVDSFLVGHLLHVLIMRLRDHDKMTVGATRHSPLHNAYPIGMRKQKINQHNVGLVEQDLVHRLLFVRYRSDHLAKLLASNDKFEHRADRTVVIHNQNSFHIHVALSSQSDGMSTRKVVPSGTLLSTLICAFHLFTISLT